MVMREIPREAVALTVRAILDLPDVERIELVAGKLGPYLRVHLQPPTVGRMLSEQCDTAWSVRMIAGCLGTQLGGRLAVDVIESSRSTRCN